jgi:hypothetical protein
MSDFVCRVKDTLDERTRKKWRGACKKLGRHAEYEGKQYCVLHFPSEDKKVDFKKAVEDKFTREDYDFRGTVSPKGTSEFKAFRFCVDASFRGAVFSGGATFAKTTFEGEVSFREATFKEEGNFSEAVFEKKANFRRATFETEARFEEAIFKEEVTFRRATFKGPVEFEAPSNKDSDKAHTFNRKAKFSRARFEERVTFVGASTFDANQEKVTFRFALTQKPELFILDRVKMRPSWFIDMDVRKLRFTNVQWRGLEGRPPGNIGEEIRAIENRRGSEEEEEDSQIAYPHKLLAKTCRELSSNAEDDHDYPLANAFRPTRSTIGRWMHYANKAGPVWGL